MENGPFIVGFSIAMLVYQRVSMRSWSLANQQASRGLGQTCLRWIRFMVAIPLVWWDFSYVAIRTTCLASGKRLHDWLVVWLPFFIFPYIGLLIIPIDFHIFQRGGPTTNQMTMWNHHVEWVNQRTFYGHGFNSAVRLPGGRGCFGW